MNVRALGACLSLAAVTGPPVDFVRFVPGDHLVQSVSAISVCIIGSIGEG